MSATQASATQVNPTQGESAGGRFGQTAQSSIQLADRNGDLVRTEVYRCINVTTDPNLRDAFLSGEIYQAAPADQAEPHHLALPVCYHDEELALFALVVPEQLRHREFSLRADLLDEMSQVEGPLPAYIRYFKTVIGVSALDDLQARCEAGHSDQSGVEAVGVDRAGREEPGVDQPKIDADVAADGPAGDHAADLEEAWQDIEQQREQLASERRQLDEVRARIDAEREGLDETKREVERERQAIEELGSELDVRELNLEQERLRLEQGQPTSNAAESTQVVTDDQFIEVVDDAADDVDRADAQLADAQLAGSDDGPADGPPRAEATELIDNPYGAGPGQAEAGGVRVERVEESTLPETFEADGWRTIEVVDGEVVACAKLPADVIDSVDEAAERSFFVQLNRNEGHPLLGLLLAALDSDDQAETTIGWALNPVDPDDQIVLDRFGPSVALTMALYDESDSLAAVWKVDARLHDNVEWIRQRIESLVDDRSDTAESFVDAANRWQSVDYQRLGQMRHNFHDASFEEATTPAELKLAAGIVGYWTTPAKFEYLVANRSFPLDVFEAIQQRVVRRAVDQGIWLNAELRDIAVDMGLAADEVALVEGLAGEFAEVSLGLRSNDLDPLEEWQNWQALVELGETLGVTLDSDVLELAEASLRRAQDFQETGGPEQVGGPGGERTDDALATGDAADLVVARRSESTGITYFLPDEAVLDTFEDLAAMDRDDLELLLDDPKGRLEAAQILVERFGADGLQAALAGAEQMTTAEVVALAKFLETKAGSLEEELVDGLAEAGPSATFGAARALVSIRSEQAIGPLLEVYADPERRGDKHVLARTLAGYGDQLVPAVKRTIKQRGASDEIVELLGYLEDADAGVLASLAKDRNKKLRRAAGAARDRRG